MFFVSYVYGLKFNKLGHPLDGMIRYVGKAKSPKKRLWWHRNPKSNCKAIAASMLRHGTRSYTIEVLAEVRGTTQAEADEEALKIEIKKIAELGTTKKPLGLNLTIGGDGVNYSTPQQYEDHAERARLILRNPANRKRHGIAIRKKHSDKDWTATRVAASKAAMDCDEIREKRVIGINKVHADPIIHQGYVDRMRKLGNDPEMRAKAKAAIQDRFKDADYLEAHRQRFKKVHQSESWQKRHAEVIAETAASPEARKKRSKTMTAMFQDPVFVKSHLKGIADREANPVSRLRRNIGVMTRWVAFFEGKGNGVRAEEMRTKIAALRLELASHV